MDESKIESPTATREKIEREGGCAHARWVAMSWWKRMFSRGFLFAALALALAVSARAQSVSITSPNGVFSATNPQIIAGTFTGTVTTITVTANGVALGNAAILGTTWSIAWIPAAVGDYLLRATPNTGTSAVVSVSVSAIAPAVSLVLSGGGASIPAGSSRYVTISATDDGSIEHVELYYDGVLTGTKTSAPYSILFTAPGATGTHTLWARAYDNAGLSTTSATTTIEIGRAIGAPTTVGVSTPSNGAFVGVGSATILAGSCGDSDGVVGSVQVFANGVSLGNAVLSNGAWSLSWTPSSAGTYSITALATDDKANAIISPSSVVNVTDNSSPAINLSMSPGTNTLATGSTRYLLAGVMPTAGRAIVRVEFFVNGTKTGEKTAAPYALKYTAPASPGVCAIVARATDNAGFSRDAQLTLNIVSAVGVGPSVAMLIPAPNSTVAPGTSVTLAAAATATGGSVTSMQFFQNGAPVDNVLTAPPFVVSFTPTLPGSYGLEAIATDDRGNTAISTSLALTAAFGTPSIALVTPRNSTRATPGVPVSLTVAVTGGGGAAVTLVEFLLDGRVIGASAALPYSITWTPDAGQLGAHQLTARLIDANSLSATSAAVNVTVASVVGLPPAVSILSPTETSSGVPVRSLSSINLTAGAFDPDGSISSVEFFLADVSVGLAVREQASNVYRLVFDFSRFNYAMLRPDATGRFSLSLYAIARDNDGNESSSDPVPLLVTPSSSSPPGIAIVASAVNLTAGGSIQLTSTVKDSDGAVVSVQYFANGSAIAASTSAPLYAVNFTPSAAGRFNVYGVATDDTGNTTVSPAVVINVTGNTAPTVALVRPENNAVTTTVGAPVFLEATATDVDAGQTLAVAFLGNGELIATGQRVGSSNRYRAVWTPAVSNRYLVTARATDSVGAQTISTVARSVVVNEVVGLAPAIAMEIPESVTTASTASFTATALDSDGLATAVEFFVNSVSIGQALHEPSGNLWRIVASFGGLPIGPTEVVAVAKDNSGNFAGSTTASINVVAATSAPPTITIVAEKSSVTLSQPVQLTASAFDSDGAVTSVRYFANGVSIGSSNAPGFPVTWTPAGSGTFNLYALATDTTGNTTVSGVINLLVKPSNPLADDDAFIVQTFQDLLGRNPNSVELSSYSARFSAGTLSRAQLVATLSADPSFASFVNLCAAYYLLMNEWPVYTNYQTLVANRAGLDAVVGLILASPEYRFTYGLTTEATLNASFATAYTPFATRLWQTALGRAPSVLELVQFHDNDTAFSNLGRGYTVAGLNTAIAEFITLTNAGNARFWKLARVAALCYQLLKAAPSSSQVNALAALPDTAAVAASILGSSLYLNRYVTITSQPSALVVAPGSGALFRVTATGQPPLAYEWFFNGVPLAGATSAVLGITAADTTKTGSYTVVVSSAVAAVTSDPATLMLSSQPTLLGNLSTRGVAGLGANVLTAGFVVSGSTTKPVLIRAVGPGLSALGVTGFQADPSLAVINSAGVVLHTNDNWSTQAGGSAAVSAIQQAATRVGAFALGANSLDAAVLATLTSGSYTVQVRGALASGAGSTASDAGVALIEIYDASSAAALTGSKTVNVSTRGYVGTGENVLIAGFVVNGTVSRRLLIRGVGPALASFGLPATTLLPDPQIKLLDAKGTTIAANDNWAVGDDAALIASAATTAGAFPLASGSKDSAILVMLAPGAYTAQVSGVGLTNNTGLALVEVYDVDP